jgi:hypothetical protein
MNTIYLYYSVYDIRKYNFFFTSLIFTCTASVAIFIGSTTKYPGQNIPTKIFYDIISPVIINSKFKKNIRQKLDTYLFIYLAKTLLIK